MTQQYHLASMAAWLSSTGISHHNLLPHTPSICLSTVNSSLHPGIAPQSLNSSSQLLCLLGDLLPCLGYAWLRQGLSILIPFKLPQISCFTLSLKCSSSDSDNCPDVGIGPLLQFPHPPRAGPILLTLLFFPLAPLSYRVLCGFICTFPMVRYSCRLSAGVPHALLCICGEYSTSPTPLPFCSLLGFISLLLFKKTGERQLRVLKCPLQVPIFILSLLVP